MAQGGTGKALCVFLLTQTGLNDLRKQLTAPRQLSFADITVVPGLPQPRTTLRYRPDQSTPEKIVFRATHHSPTEQRPIRVLCHEPQEEIVRVISNDELDIDSGRMEDLEPPVEVPGILTGNPSTIRTAFQHVYGFPVEVDVATGRVFVYAVKDIALSFAARLSQDGHFVTEKLCFDFGRIDETPAIENVVNAWANSSGAVRKIAFFGTDVHHAEGMKEKQFTSIRVDYEHDGELIDLQISREGRISTRSPTVTNGDLKDIFEKLAVALGLGRCSDQIIQDSS